MKRYKSLTRKQKEQLTGNDKRLNVRNWWFRSETENTITVINKFTNRVKILPKI